MRRSLYLLYHELTERPTPYGYAQTAELFEAHLRVLEDARSTADDLYPEITFDDGHLSNATLASPLLERFGMQAHFFITAGWTSMRTGYMSAGQVRELHQLGHRIGAHGWSHKLLTHCSSQELEVELTQARKHLEDLLGAEVIALSLPGGRFNKFVLNACEKAGYQQIFTSIPAPVAPNASLLGRVNLRADMTSDKLAALLDPDSGVLDRMARNARLKQASQRVLGDTLYSKLWNLVNRASAQASDDQYA